MIMMSFGYFFHRVIGMVLQHVWDGKHDIMGNPIYSSDNLYNALMVLPISLAIAILGYSILVIFEKRTKKIVA